MKRYIDERRRQQAAQTRQFDVLRKSHQEQFDKLNSEMDRVSHCYLYPASHQTIPSLLLLFASTFCACRSI